MWSSARRTDPRPLAIVESFSPDVALIDIAMPGMDGPDLAQLLRLQAQCSLTKLVALTGSTDTCARPRRTNRYLIAIPPSQCRLRTSRTFCGTHRVR